MGLGTAVLLAALAANSVFALTSTLQTVTNWGGANPNGLTMQIYVPTTVKQRPAVLLANHYCTGTGLAFFQGTEWATFADQYGFIVIYPSTPAGRNPQCWDVCTAPSLTHNGGSDTLTLANMVKYVWSTYGSDASRTFVTGVSSGGMMTEVMMAAYPDMFVAGAEFAGVPYYCFQTTDGSLWNSACSTGQRVYTPSVWGDYVRSAYPGYTGKYPRFMAWHGTVDEAINYNNFVESIDQWTNVHGVSQTPSKTDTPSSGWTRTFYGSPDSSGQYPVVGVSLGGVNHASVYQWGMGQYVIDFFGIPALSNGSSSTTTSRTATTTTTTRASTTTTTTTRSATTTTSTRATTTTTTTRSTTTTTTTRPTTTTTTSAASPSPTSGSCAAKWAQCGGIGWTGVTCCISGTTCTKLNDYYFQCL